MAQTIKRHTRTEITDENGELMDQLGRNRYQLPRIISATGNERARYRLIVADNYTRVVVWQDGDQGLAAFDYLWIETDAAILMELAIARAGGSPTYSVIEVPANQPFEMMSDDMVNAVLTNGSATTMDQVDQIALKNNTADAAGDANVTLILYD